MVVYVMFAFLNYASFTYEFKTQIACETAIHNFKVRWKVADGFCQEVKK